MFAEREVKMQFQMNSTETEDVLFECSFLLISILLKQYKQNLIDLDCFKSNSTNKIQYILNNYHKLQDKAQKILIKNLLKECIELNNNANAQK